MAEVPDPLINLPGYALRRAASAMMAELGARLGRAGLRVTEASVMLLLGEREGLTSSEIGKVFDIQRANMVPLLNRLELAGLIARRPLDRKSVAIVLTPEGRAKVGEVQALTQEFETDLLARIPAEHRDHLVPALQALWCSTAPREAISAR